jgi:hypothetical protein
LSRANRKHSSLPSADTRDFLIASFAGEANEKAALEYIRKL